MENKINIAEILKNCPQGMELDCTMFDDAKFIDIEENNKPICIKTGDIFRYLTKFGTWTFDENAKCVIFPKGKTTWEGFQRPFKDGDIVITTLGNTAVIKEPAAIEYFAHCILVGAHLHTVPAIVCVGRLATEEEKQELFDAIKDKGYKWNDENKTLDKLIEPEFKVGDRIRYKRGNRVKLNIVSININEQFYHTSDKGRVYFKYQDDWDLVPDKFKYTKSTSVSKKLIRIFKNWKTFLQTGLQDLVN